MDSSTQSGGLMSNNVNMLTSEVIEQRIDTSRLIAALKQMLEGKVIVPETDRESGTLKYRVISSGEPLMNDKGVQMMMVAFNMMFSPFFAQGFITRDDYERIVEENDNNISESVMNNLIEWEVNIINYDHIINSVITLHQGYSSQAIDGHLTKSITQSIQLRESNTVKEGGGWKLPFTGG